MGKGDRRSRRGKIFMGSYGKTRPARRKKAGTMPAAPTAEKKAPAKKKAASKKKEAKD